ncbi:MAG: CBS domain-containing protein [candidate division Zixibacteria bacterium]|nr:CBS domain-containing protein [candidate division Zixibacteria bacterium]
MLVKNTLEQLNKKIVTASSKMTIEEAMDLLITNKIGCLPVLNDGNQIVGILSDKDIFHKIHETKGDYKHLKVEDIMTTEVVVGIPEDEINTIANIMDNNWIRHVPIVKDDKMVGLLSIGDVNRAQMESTKIENRYLKLYTGGMGSRDKSSDY